MKLYPNPNQNVGYLNQTQSPHTGQTAELWKHIYEDGVLVDSYQVNSSTYQAVGTAYDVGVASTSQALTQAMYTAIATNEISQVQAVIANASAYTNPQTEAPQQPQTDAPAQTPTEAPTQPQDQPITDPNAGGTSNPDVIIDGTVTVE